MLRSSTTTAGPRSARRRLLALLSTASLAATGTAAFAPPAIAAAGGSTITLNGGEKTYTDSAGDLFAKLGAPLTLEVTGGNSNGCITVSGGGFTGQGPVVGSSSATFTAVAGSGNGEQFVTVTYWSSPNCKGNGVGEDTSYMLDNTGPVVTGQLTPKPNEAGWNSSDVTVTWTATDNEGGVGVDGGPEPATTVVSENGIRTKKATATDLLGNSGNGEVGVHLDKVGPAITGARTPVPNAKGWNNTAVTVDWTCTDPTDPGVVASGITSCPASRVLDQDGKGQKATGTVQDRAGNSSSATVSDINIDTVAPTLRGEVGGDPVDGWYRDDVPVTWTATDDGGSGVAEQPNAGVIRGEGLGLSTTASVRDNADNTRQATSPAVNIDRTAPVTTVSAPPAWNKSDVSLTLDASDGLSQVNKTYYQLDGGDTVVGSSVSVSDEGNHSLKFWSTDRAGNTETARTVEFGIDKTAPTIGHTQDPSANVDGWNNSDVTVTFQCADTVSGVASCTEPQTVSKEGAAISVVGTVSDKAGNTASDPATVSLDKTAPVVSLSPLPEPNAAGWYDHEVTVGATATDVLSGVKTSDAPRRFGEGEQQTATLLASDLAGNTGSATTATVNVDLTAPTITGKVVTEPGSGGWFTDDVTVHWACDDNLSGVVSCPDNSVVTGEGNDLTASASVQDKAGHTTTATVTGVKIDRSAPTTTAHDVPAGWVKAPATVALDAFDNLSGEVTTYFSVDGSDPVKGNRVTVGAEGRHTVSYWSVDAAGNTEQKQSFAVQVDLSSPTVTAVQAPEANAQGWNNSDVTVRFDCADQPELSGLASCTDPQTVTDEGRAQEVNGSAIDFAGNRATGSAVVNLDKTAPSITGSPDRAANDNGWYDDDVTVTFRSEDALSGTAWVTPPQRLGEGGDQSVTGSATDAADNTASTTMSGLNVDETAPSLSAAPTEAPGPHGWYNHDVTLEWSANDDLSGLDGDKPADSILSSEGGAQSATATVRDKAGNRSTATSAPVKIDKTAPVTDAAAPSGWSNGEVRVQLTARDGLSGPDQTFYSVDGGDEVAGTTVTLDDEGVHEIAYHSTDLAGNVEASKSTTVKIDKTAPTIAHEQTPAKNGNGWNNTDVTVTFTCDDQADLSGVRSCTGPTTLTDEGQGQVVEGTATDEAGNSSTDRATVSIDKTAPTIIGTRAPAPNNAGWNNTDVTVHFEAADEGGSGVDLLTPDTILGEGTGQSVLGTVVDGAGNATSTEVMGINVDQTAPTLTGAPMQKPNADGWYRGDVTIGWEAKDERSGIATRPEDSVITGEGSGLTATTTVQDRAGNSTTATGPAVNIDRTAPVTGVNAPDGWSNGEVRLTLTAGDNLSTVAGTYYRIDDGDLAQGTALTVSGEGVHQVRYHSVDVAGNVEAEQTAQVRIDLTRPTVRHTLTPAANEAGWNNAPVTVDFTCDDRPSGVASCSPSAKVETDGKDQIVAGTAVDKAGNTQVDVAKVSLDTVKPRISGAADREPNRNNWYAGDVTVGFTCTDDLSGVGDCSGSETLGEGGDQQVTGHALDVAGNSSAVTVGPVNIDKSAPQLSGAVTTQPNGNGWYNGDVTVRWSGEDTLSGLDGPLPGDGTITGEGTGLTTSASLRDRAGNETTTTSPAVKIDRHAPTTAVSDISDWSKDDVTVTLTATDNLSQVASTHYQLDSQAPVSGTEVTISDEGTHVLKVWSVDRAGNVEAVRNLEVKVDKTAPSISHEQEPLANERGWNNGDVEVTFTCTDTDGGSGIASCTAPQTVTSEGLHQSVLGTAVDHAGNSATDPASVSIDKSAPTLTGHLSATPNSNGWFKDDVTVSFTCADQDGLSGVLSCPESKTLGEGEAQEVGGAATDAADNTSKRVVVGSINVDKTAPVLSGSATAAPNDDGWYRGDVLVAWKASDPLSGLDGAVPAASTVTGEGADNAATATVSDRAGNSTTVTVDGIRIDRTAPSTSATAPTGWQNDDVTVELAATDQLSGVAATYYRVDGAERQSGTSITVKEQGLHDVEYWSVDKAGNAESRHTATVLIDRTPPSIAGAATTEQNGAGWYAGPVRVHFTCQDQPGLSGIRSCEPDATLSAQGVNTVTGKAFDNAGNTAAATVDGIRIDTVAPAVSVGGVTDGAVYELGAAPTPTCSATDGTSGLAGPCSGERTGGTPGGVGTFIYTATASDKAGNTGVATATYSVRYAMADTVFLEPVAATGHQGTSSTAVFKAGQTIPMKFQLRNAAGELVEAGSAPRWITPQRTGATGAAVNADALTDGVSSGDTYTLQGKEYQYNWKTDKAQAGSTWRVGVGLDDGQTYYVTVGLR